MPSRALSSDDLPHAALQHTTVLLVEAVDAVAIRPEGTYVDGTFGRGGHSRALLARLGPTGRLIGFDKDPEAVAVGQALAAEDARFAIVHASFATWRRNWRRAASPMCTACCWTWASARRRSTTPRGASASGSTRRWTCAWTPPVAKPPRISWPAPTSAASRR
jgi:hypothetical protein